MGMPVHFSLLIRRNRSNEEINTGGCVSLNGRVVRGDDSGLGVAFSEEYRIMRTSHLFGPMQCRFGLVAATKTGEKAPLLINR